MNQYPLKPFRYFRKAVLKAVYLAAALLLPGDVLQGATNVLANPGFETGSRTGWTGFYTPYCNANCNGIAVESTNTLVYNGGSSAGASNVISHSGLFVGKDYGQFIGPANKVGAYQDAVAAAGSVWSAGGFALSHHQDFISGGNQFWFQVYFIDSSSNLLTLHRSEIIDSTVVPDAWTNVLVKYEIDWINDPTGLSIAATNFSFSAPPGAAKVRFQIVFAQTSYDGGSVYFDDLDLTKIAASDPDITSGPASQRKVVGQTVTFSVVAAGATTLQYEWVHNGTNILSNGGSISGATGSTLTIANLGLADAGSYTVRVIDTAGAVTSSPAILTVVSTSQASNVLDNPGFETGSEFPWFRFNGGGLRTSNDFYYGTSIPIEVLDGKWVSQSYYGGPEWNGMFQDRPAAPGDTFAAEGWVRVQSEDQIANGNTCWIEVQFMNAAENMIGFFRSGIIDSTFPTSTWVNLQVTNVIAFWGDWSVAGSAKYLVAPPGTTKARYQVTFRGTPGGTGSVWYDNMSLFLRNPVTVTASLSGSSIRLSFPAQIGVSYQVLSKNDLSDADWQVIGTVTGDLSGQATFSEPTGSKRFYRVNTL